MSELCQKQLSLFHSIARSLDNFKKIGKNKYTAAKIRSRVTSLKETWTQCLQNHAALLQAIPEDKRGAVAYFKDQLFDIHEDVYQDTLDYMAECLEDIEPPSDLKQSSRRASSHGDSISSFSLSHLPPIKIPPFSGNYDEWESFRDRFTSLIIGNNDLNAFARMHFLASSLTGRALESIRTIPITADNFEIAWTTLVSRYENKRRLIEAHVSALHKLPSVSRENAGELNVLRDKANRAIASLRNLGRSSDEILNDILVYRVSQQLDNSTRKAWKLKGSDDTSVPTYDELDRFIATRARALEELTTSNAQATRAPKITSTTALAINVTCPLCKAAHFINKCPKFVKKSPSQRMEIIKQATRCLNCLSSKHSVQSCMSKYSCRICQRRHHSMLHLDSASSSSGSAISHVASPSEASDTAAVTALCSTVPSRPSVLLATARVKVTSQEGRNIVVRALLDQGSEMTFITARLSSVLKLRHVKRPISLAGVGGVNAGRCRWAAQIKISPFSKSFPVLTTTASILKSLTTYSPPPRLSNVSWSHLADLALADPDPLSSEPIDVLIGADLYNELLLDGIRRGPSGQPSAQNTNLGWILSGRTSVLSSSRKSITVQHSCTSVSLDQELRRFWEIEEGPRRVPLTPEEQQCETHFQSTYSRDCEGRYIVRLPFKRGPPIAIGESYNIAKRLINGLQRRLETNSALKTEYVEFMDEYERLGHMGNARRARVSMSLYSSPSNNSGGQPNDLRVVFNASSRTTNGTSLNDHLLIGPKLQNDLAAVILRWRQYRYVYSADIAKMYRQIKIDPRDLDYQRILWTDKTDNSIQPYQLKTVTYGTASAPFLALRVICQLVKDEGEAFPLASPILENNIYVDDVLFGADDIPILRQAREQVCALLQRGKFELRKWASNSSRLLENIDDGNHGLACSKNLQLDENLKILGVAWNPLLDVFQFRATLPSTISQTKRSILSTITKLFDPLGWSTPVTVTAKIFLQQLWQVKLDWDAKLPVQLQEKWTSIQSSLAGLHNLELDRWTSQGSDTVKCELHGFSDASSVAYAAAVYLTIQSVSGEIRVTLLGGKSKVAPIKSLSIPRLELAAAVLLTKVMEFVRTSLSLTTASCYCWTDSTIVLAWISQHPSRWKTFVANRVSEIQSRLPNASWRHISTDENPADCASRGIPEGQLSSHHLWWNGPSWLRLPETEWPAQISVSEIESVIEQNSRVTINLVQPIESWDLALFVVAEIDTSHSLLNALHFAKPLFSKSFRRRRKYFRSFHRRMQSRTKFLVKAHSRGCVLGRTALLEKQSVSRKSPIASLNPFIGEDELIRVGGRLSNAPLPFKSKHPILLAAHPLVPMIIRQAHLQALHAGTQLTIATLRREFWILRGRTMVKAVIHRSIACTREKAVIPEHIMGDLPTVRVSPPERAFLHCGLDYAGPMQIRATSGRGIASRKAYIAIFVCMATRAVHLEVVEGYSTPAFLGAFSRFCARRGLPTAMYSDNGTTFVGANRELTAAFRASIKDPNFLNYSASRQITWKFIPPAAPHFGGLWEAGVKSVKYHLRRVLGSHTLTFEEFSTLLCNIEAYLNSRPLAPLTDSLDDYEPLTPGHFLIGAPITAHPEPSILNLKENRLSRWQVVRQLTERFWKLWQTDYLNTLQQRVKWRTKHKSQICPGQLILIRNSLLPPCKWELGRITKCHPGQDNVVRVVTVKTAVAEYKRPVVKLCLLPVALEHL